MPVEAHLELTIFRAGGADNAALAAAEARVPQPVSATEAGLTARRANNDKRKPLVFGRSSRAHRPAGRTVRRGTDGGMGVAHPQARAGARPAANFGFELDGLPPGVDPKGPFELTFTIVKDGSATEVKTHLD